MWPYPGWWRSRKTVSQKSSLKSQKFHAFSKYDNWRYRVWSSLRMNILKEILVGDQSLSSHFIQELFREMCSQQIDLRMSHSYFSYDLHFSREKGKMSLLLVPHQYWFFLLACSRLGDYGAERTKEKLHVLLAMSLSVESHAPTQQTGSDRIYMNQGISAFSLNWDFSLGESFPHFLVKQTFSICRRGELLQNRYFRLSSPLLLSTHLKQNDIFFIAWSRIIEIIQRWKY